MGEVQSGDPFGGFDPAIQEVVEGLVWLGRLEKTVKFCGHSFTLRTLTVEEELAVAQAINDYKEGVKAGDAYAAATIGVALEAVDGDESFCPPIGPDLIGFAKARLNYVSQWYLPTIQYLFQQYTTLLQQQAEAIEAIQNLSRRSQPLSTPSADSLTSPGDLTVD